MVPKINFDDLPPLKGSKNQIKRAQEIRAKRINEIKGLMDGNDNITHRDYKVITTFIHETSAKIWIVNQDESIANLLLSL